MNGAELFDISLSNHILDCYTYINTLFISKKLEVL